MTPQFDVIVVGGGIIGASLALALGRARVDVALVEPQAPRPPASDAAWDTRIYTLSPGNAGWLTELGVWQTLPAERLARVEAMRIFGGTMNAELRFSAYDAGARELAWTIENGLLQRALWDALESAPHVAIQASARCADVAWGADLAHLRLEDGSHLDARLVVAADGGDSWVRSRAGIAAKATPYAQLGVVANFETERPHEETAFQWFRDDGVLAFLPLPGNRVSMVWSTGEAHGRALLAASAADLEDEVARASAGVGGGLRVITEAAAFPLQRMRAERLVEPRAALIGDAAHIIHPLAGQGMNLGMRDARELARVLDERGPQKDCGDFALLRRYERARKEDILAFEAATDGLQKLFSPQAVWLAGARDLGLKLVDMQPHLKNLLIRHAMA